MTTNSFLVTYLLTALVAAVLGGVAMELVMWIIAKAGLAKGDMILALGSLLTKRRENAYRVGFIVHTSAALGFALLYTLLLVTLHVSDMPQSMMLGLGVGVLQGILVSLMLIWIVAEQHPNSGHANTARKGSINRKIEPCPISLTMLMCPPKWRARSRMPITP